MDVPFYETSVCELNAFVGWLTVVSCTQVNHNFLLTQRAITTIFAGMYLSVNELLLKKMLLIVD